MDDFTGAEVIETERLVLFWKPPAVFSQWTRSPFEVEGQRYLFAEQYMMAEKARLFGDDGTLARILASPSPRTQRALGQRVAGFDELTWRERRLAIVEAGNLAKFAQNPDMLAVLLATGEKTLVEASPMDSIWGIGLRADDPRALEPASWQGKNLLGIALMAVRSRLGGAPTWPQG